jgi:hypothetical protein
MILQWTRIYCNMQYLKYIGTTRTPRNIQISLCHHENGSVILRCSDLTSIEPTNNKEFRGSLDEAIKIAESWVKL